MIQKIPILNDIKSFLPIARIYGYTFFKKNCTKTIVYDALDCIIEININLLSGLISFKSYTTNILCTLNNEDKKYLLKDITHLVKWIKPDELEGN